MRSRLKLHQAAPTGCRDGLSEAQYIQLGEDAAEVGLHGGLADVEVGADFLIALASCQQGQDIQLPHCRGQNEVSEQVAVRPGGEVSAREKLKC